MGGGEYEYEYQEALVARGVERLGEQERQRLRKIIEELGRMGLEASVERVERGAEGGLIFSYRDFKKFAQKSGYSPSLATRAWSGIFRMARRAERESEEFAGVIVERKLTPEEIAAGDYYQKFALNLERLFEVLPSGGADLAAVNPGFGTGSEHLVRELVAERMRELKIDSLPRRLADS